jgi:hypothetical protein
MFGVSILAKYLSLIQYLAIRGHPQSLGLVREYLAEFVEPRAHRAAWQSQ